MRVCGVCGLCVGQMGYSSLHGLPLHEQYGTYMRHEGEQSTRAARLAQQRGGV